MNGVTITLAGPPRGKGRPRFARATGRAYTDAATQNYEAALRIAAQEAMGDMPPFDGPLHVEVIADLPIPTSWSRRKRLDAVNGAVVPTVKPDVDNLLKCIDALNGVVWNDDKQIVVATVHKWYAEKPGLEIRVIMQGTGHVR